MLEKYARAEVLDVRSSPTQLGRTASLSKFSEYNDYRTDDDYLYVRVRAISSRVNKNNDGWPSEELKKSYTSFLNKPIFVDHNNHDPSRGRGVVVDAALHIEDDLDKASKFDPYYATAPAAHKPPTWIELLLETDAKAFPKLAKAIVDGDIDGVSMGCNVERSKCSICSNWATTPQEYCSHVKSKGAHFDYTDPDTGHKTSKKAYEDCYGVGFFEISYVFDPADETALFQGINDHLQTAASVYEEAGETDLFHKVTDWDLGFTYDRPKFAKTAGWGDELPRYEEYAPEPPKDTGLSFDDLPEAPVLSKIALDAFIKSQPLRDSGQLSADSDHTAKLNAWTAVNKWVGPNGEKPPVGAAKYFSDKAFDTFASEMTNAITNDQVGNDSPWQHSQISETERWKPDFMNQINLKNPMRPQGSTQCPMCDKEGFEVTASTNDRCKYCGYRSQRVAQNPLPQSDLTKAPVKIDTLRQETVCPVCGSTMEDGKCPVCNYEEPPDGFDNPDLEKAKEMDQQVQPEQGAPPEQPMAPPQPQGMDGSSGLPQAPPSGMGAMSATKNNVTTELTNRTSASDNKGGRINTQERPILPVTRQNSDKPQNVKVVTDSTRPVESKTIGENTNMSDQTKTADSNGATNAPERAQNRVDVTGVGGVAGDPESGTTHQNVDTVGGEVLNEEPQQVEVDKVVKTDDSGPTRTWHGIKGDGDSAGQQSPVTPQTMNQALSFVNKESLEIFGDPLTNGDTKTVDLLADLKQEVGGPTSTWGSDDFHITDPVTNESFPVGTDSLGDQSPAKHKSPVTEPFMHGETGSPATHGGPETAALTQGEVKSHIYASIRVAETEVELGIISPEDKWNRAEELEGQPTESLEARLDTLSRVRTAQANAPKTASTRQPIQKQATRAPHLQAGVSHEATFTGAESLFI